jgi:hypothetical protein
MRDADIQEVSRRQSVQRPRLFETASWSDVDDNTSRFTGGLRTTYESKFDRR